MMTMSIEIPLKAKYSGRKKGVQKSKHNDGGTPSKKKELSKAQRDAAMVATRENQMMMIMDGPHLKKRWVRVRDM
jgi:hypothetical protein